MSSLLPHERERSSIERITWVVDGRAVPVTPETRWTATALAYGGYDRFTMEVPAKAVRHAGQGAPVVGYRANGDVLWRGRLSTDPVLEDSGAVTLRATGPRALLDNNYGQLFYCELGASEWVVADSDPFHYNVSVKMETQTKGSRMGWVLDKNQTYANGNVSSFVRWIPGQDIQKISFTVRKSGTLNNWEYVLWVGEGPNPATEERTWTVSSHSDGEVITDNLSTPYDCVRLGLRCTQDATTHAQNEKIWVQDLQLWGLGIKAPTTGLVAARVAADLNLDGTDIAGHSTVELDGFHWQDGSYADLMDYLSMIEDWRWSVLNPTVRRGDERLVFEPWGHRPLRVVVGEGNLDTQEFFNRVVVRYESSRGVPVDVVVNAPPQHDPLARYGVVNSLYYDLGSDVRPDQKLARLVAARLLEQALTPRATGSIAAQSVVSSHGPQSPYGLCAGDVVKLTTRYDLAPQRVMGIAYTEEGVELEIGEELDVTRLLARRAMKVASRGRA